MKVAAITQGRCIPSARFRVRQYIPALQALDIDVKEFCPAIDSYPPAAKWLRPLWAAALLSERLTVALASYRYDLTLLQREFLSTFSTLEILCKSPRVLDVDDAIFLYRGGHYARRLAQMSQAVICGNVFLAEWFGQWNPRIFVIPTAVDTRKYKPISSRERGDRPLTIGWIGTSVNHGYLSAIERPLHQLLSQHPNAIFSVVSDRRPNLQTLQPDRFRFHHWSEEFEAELIQSFDIGIMPLTDSMWARGKCSYKMLQYMSTGIPVVVSPVGMNKDVLDMCDCGFAALSHSDWFDALDSLLRNDSLRASLGAKGRQCVESAFSIDAVAPRIAEVLDMASDL